MDAFAIGSFRVNLHVMPSHPPQHPSQISDRFLHSILFLTVAVPALAISWGQTDGHTHFILYREPKLVAAALCSWLLLAALVWLRPTVFSFSTLSQTLRRPALLVAATFLGYLATTGIWVKVPENHLYELSQYLTLSFLLVALLSWAREDPKVSSTVLQGLAFSLALVTVLGAIQWTGSLPFLAPINPEIGAPHPSLMGYKNPAALAVLGQLFLLGYLVTKTRSAGLRMAGMGLLLLELAYIATLRSRSAYIAIALGAFYFIALRFLRRPSRNQLLRTLAAVAVLGVLFGAFLLANDQARERFGSTLEFVANPKAYLDSDRGTYLRNTLQMVRHHPLGVGLGDWQTHYPVFRRYNRTLSFDNVHQVRRAHADHVQFFGEAGWPGFLLWAAFLLLLILGTAREYLKTGRARPLFISAQLFALATAMASDYLIELPYNKFQFFLVVFLALAPRRESSVPPQQMVGKRSPRHLLMALFITALTLGSLTYHVGQLRKVHYAAVLTDSYSHALARLSRDGRVASADLERVLYLGRLFDAQFGLTKTLHKDYLALAHSAHLLGQQELAEILTEKSLRLHPYSPNALRLMTKIVQDPHSQEWEIAYQHVMYETRKGFTKSYPASQHGMW